MPQELGRLTLVIAAFVLNVVAGVVHWRRGVRGQPPQRSEFVLGVILNIVASLLLLLLIISSLVQHHVLFWGVP
jgi:hypothetical protein